MPSILLAPTPMAHWQSLVREAEVSASCRLSEDCESYLVFLLMRFLSRPEMASNVMALDYLNCQLKPGTQRTNGLRDVGDQCLLISGFYPKRARRRHVRIAYFVNLGRSAYSELASTLADGLAGCYQQLERDFVKLMDVLYAVREMDKSAPVLDGMEAIELWQDTGSKAAYKALGGISNGIPAFIMPKSKN
jgi:hypothetical protein